MSNQYWDDVLYPPFRATIRGEYYGVVTEDNIDEECYYMACRAISAFKFPKISTEYTVYRAIRDDNHNLITITEDDDNYDEAIPHAYFNNTLSQAEIDIIVAWMKVYWCEYQISNADNFEEIYTDVNIKTFSRANAVSKNLKMLEQYREYAKDLENRYSRVSATRTPSLGDIN